MTSAKLIASAPNSSYDWVIDAVKDSPHAFLSSTLELAKSITHLKTKDTAKVNEHS